MPESEEVKRGCGVTPVPAELVSSNPETSFREALVLFC